MRGNGMIYDKDKGFLPEREDLLGVFDEDRLCDLIPTEYGDSAYEEYFFDGEKGKDSNEGKRNSPKKSFAEMERLCLSATGNKGISLRLKGGTVFCGSLTLRTDGRPLKISSYGEGKAVLCGGENVPYVLGIASSGVWVSNLEITGKTAYRGVYCSPEKCGVLRNVTVENCFVHDVNFLWEGELPPSETDPDGVDVDAVCPDKDSPSEAIARWKGVYSYEEDGVTQYRYNRRSHGGIVFINGTFPKEGASWFENIFILNNRVENVARTGIYVANVWADKPGVGYGRNKFVAESETYNLPTLGVGYYPHKNVVCSGNDVVCAGGDGVILSSVQNAFFEDNTCYFANYLGRTGYWNAGLWVFDADGAWIRGNEAGYTYMRHNSNDAQGFDLDNACRNVVFKRNYAYRNEGGGLLVCNNHTLVRFHNVDGTPVTDAEGAPKKELLQGRWYNNLVKDNLFVKNGNERDCTRSAFITVARESDYLFAVDNTVILRGDIEGQSVVNTEDESQFCHNHYYRGNLFYSETPTNPKFTAGMLRERFVEGNLYHNVGDLSDAMGDTKPLSYGVRGGKEVRR